MQILIKKDILTDYWHVYINGKSIIKAKCLVKLCKSLYGYVKGHPELDKGEQMRYLYKCDNCHTEPITILKPMGESSKVEVCTCGNVMNRVYTSPGITTSDGTKGA